MIRFHRNKIGRTSIKESFDNLPAGICFTNSNGLVILCNKQMHRLCYDLMGMDLQHISELEECLRKPKNGVEIINADTGVLHFPSGKVWKFTQSMITDADGNDYTQVQAADVTTLYDMKMELGQENKRLMEVNARARKLYAELDEIVREEEKFAAKIRIHDEMGELLGLTRNLMTQKEASPEKLKSVAKRWEQVTSTLGASADSGEEICDSDTALAQLKELIAGIGVTLHIQGEFPKKGRAARLLTAAMRECAVNTVRHAKGSEMTVEITKKDHILTAVITNDGKIPEGKIIEGGGLSALRRRIESVGGVMRVESAPIYKLVITFPGEEETA